MFEKMGLGTILKRYRLTVPPNQREYSWREQHVRTLFHDFGRAMLDDAPEYFLGTIVGVEKTPDLLEIVDGQQRLATTVIFLCETRNYLKTLEPLIARDITDGCLTYIDRDKKEEVTKMSLNIADNEFFNSLIKIGAKPIPAIKPSHVLIENAFKVSREQIKKIVGSLDSKDHGSVLNKWITFIERKAVAILLTVPDNVNAYKMFETLNDRGLKTSQADLVKNYLFGQSDTSRLAEAQQKWALMRGALESTFEDDITVTFLRHVLIVMQGHITAAQVFEETQKIAKGSTRALTFLDSLEKFANTYVAITNPEAEKWNGYPDAIGRAIETLNLFDIQPFQPLLLAIAEKFNPNETNKAMTMLISLGVRLIIASSTRTGSVEEPLYKAANSVYLGSLKDAKALKKELQNIIPNDQEFKQAFERERVSKASLARYYLRALEMAAKDQPNPWFIPNDDKEKISLEHVLPVKPDNNWLHFTPEMVDLYCRRIGNLALLTVKSNSDLRSADFNTKKKEYKKSGGYILTNQITREDKWTDKQIIERQKTLAVYALKAWPI